MSNPQELFSKQADDYARFRPVYPEGLFRWLSSLTKERSCAWDCATGNGQAALALASYYPRVIATDSSQNQLEHAWPHPKIEYRTASAEDSGIPSGSVDLVIVAQALHWFDLGKFYAEVRRVTKPIGSAIGVWCYGLLEITPAVNRVVSWYYHDVVGKYWEPQRRLVEQGYQGLSFPFEEIALQSFSMEANWTLNHLLGYLGTWSATQTTIRLEGRNPLDAIQVELQEAWGHEESARRVRWPLSVRVGMIRE